MAASRKYSMWEDALILDATKEFNPQDYKVKSKELLALLEPVSEKIHRSARVIKDRYFRLTGIKPSMAVKLAPGPKAAYEEKEQTPVVEPAPIVHHVTDKLIKVEYPPPKKEEPPKQYMFEPSFIKPPTKAQLMSRTGFLVRRNNER